MEELLKQLVEEVQGLRQVIREVRVNIVKRFDDVDRRFRTFDGCYEGDPFLRYARL